VHSIGSGSTNVSRGLSRFAQLSLVLAALILFGSALVVPAARPAAADQISSLRAQAKVITQELIQDQLESDAYQQQYSVATAKVEADQQAIAATQAAIVGDQQRIARSTRQVRKIALLAYVLNGSVSSTTGAALLQENVETIQSGNVYASITEGNLTLAVAELHTAQAASQGQESHLVEQRAADQALQTQQASYLNQADATTNHLASLQAQVTGQLAVAVDQEAVSEKADAASAVAAAQRGNGTQVTSYSSGDMPDPTLNAFLLCVRKDESGGNYQAVSPNGLYRGAFQFSQSTWNYAAQAANHPELVGVPPNDASKAAQDTVAVALYALDGERPWLGDRCNAQGAY
jgi:hypothetical protein